MGDVSTAPGGEGGEGGGFREQSLVVRGVGLRNIVVVSAIGVELHTSATGQAAAALDLSRLAGLASEGALACVLVEMSRMPCMGARRGLSVYCRVGPTMRCACISPASGSVAESRGPLRHEFEIASHRALYCRFTCQGREGGWVDKKADFQGWDDEY